jgi:hypothetical protein
VSQGYVREEEEWTVACQEVVEAAIKKTKKEKTELLAKRDVRVLQGKLDLNANILKALLVEKRTILANYHDEEVPVSNDDSYATLKAVCAEQFSQIKQLESENLELRKGSVEIAERYDSLEQDLRQDLATARAESDAHQQELGEAQAHIEVLELKVSNGADLHDSLKLDLETVKRFSRNS